jgi:hypothetical protein
MPSASPIAALRRAEAILRASGDPEGLAVADGLARHVYEGASLPHALGLVLYGGGGGHAMVERRAERDRLLQEVHRRYFPGKDAPAAVAILAAMKRQDRARGRTTDDLSRRLEALIQPPTVGGQASYGMASVGWSARPGRLRSG